MSYEIANRLSIKILFNEEEFIFERANALIFVHMSCSTRISVPMLHMALQDNIDFLSESKHLGDAARIQLVIQSKDDKFSTTYAFRLNSYRRGPSNGGYMYELDAYIDASTYWHASAVNAIRGTSYSVISDIASTCGLTLLGDQTTDSQVWIPRNIPYHEWARRISERGYRSDTSFMQLGLNFDKSIVYRDLSMASAPSAKFTFGEYKEGFYTAIDIAPQTNSGTLNHFSGYAESHIEQDIEKADWFTVNSQVQINKRSGDGTMMVNRKVKDAVKQARVTYGPIDVGNVHLKYEQAMYQNRRHNNTYSVRLDLVTSSATKILLLDTVTASLDKANGYLKTYSGDYRVVSRAIHIKQNEYYEKFELIRKTMNSDMTDSVG